MNSEEMVKIAYEALSDKRDRILRSSISSLYPFLLIISLLQTEATQTRYRQWPTM